MTGIVVSREYEKLVIDTGFNTLEVDTSSLVGDEAIPQVDVGDRVSVYGEMDDADLFEGREIFASSVVTLDDRLKFPGPLNAESFGENRKFRAAGSAFKVEPAAQSFNS